MSPRDSGPIEHHTYCRNCAAHCGLLLTVQDERRIADVRPDRQHPISRGYFCVKGMMNAELHNGMEGRLCGSLKRSPDGEFVAIDSWAAIDEIAAKLADLVRRFGPRCVALFQGTGGYSNSLALPMAKSWLAALGTPNYFTSMTIDQAARWVTMLRMGHHLGGKRQLDEVDLMLLVGNNPLVSHQTGAFANPLAAFKEARQRGTRLIVIDPRRTEVARFADIHLQLLPGEDVTVAAGLVNLLFEEELQNQEFCAQFAAGVDALRAAVRQFTPSYVARRARISELDLRAAARMFGQALRPVALSGTGPCMAQHSNLADHLVECLNALCGAYRRAGELVPNSGVLFPRVHVDKVQPPWRSWEEEPKCATADAGQIFGEFPTALLPAEILQDGPNKIRALIVYAGNPATAFAQPDKTLAALADLDLLVTLDPRMTETARRSHYVIAPTLPFERHDLTVIADLFYPRPFVQYTAPVVRPPAGVVDEMLFFWGVARGMGLELVFKPLTHGMAFTSTPGGYRLDMQHPPDPRQIVRWICQGGTVPFDELLSYPGGMVCGVPPERVRPRPCGDQARLELCPAEIVSELSDILAGSFGEPSFKYRLSVRRLLEAMNSAYQDSARTLRRYPTNPAFMNPDDMAVERITTGDRVEIASEHGAIVAVARADSTVRRGVISMSHGWGTRGADAGPPSERDALTARLVSIEKQLDTITFMPRQSGIPVNIRVVSAQ